MISRSQIEPDQVLGLTPSPPAQDTVLYVRGDGAVVLHDKSRTSRKHVSGKK